MKTTVADYFLIGLCIFLLLALSVLTVQAVQFSNQYQVIIDVVTFLLAYGVYTMALLAALRRIKPYPVGCFSMNSSAFTYWKLNAVLVDLAQKSLSPFVTVFTEPLLHAGFGAKIGGQVAIGGVLRDHPLLEVGAHATIGQSAIITAHAITHDNIVLEPIKIGSGAVVGINCVVMPGVEIGEKAVLAPGAVAIRGTKIPSGELWGGIPARRIKHLDTSPE